jgi:hypothetical protein
VLDKTVTKQLKYYHLKSAGLKAASAYAPDAYRITLLSQTQKLHSTSKTQTEFTSRYGIFTALVLDITKKS